MKLPCIVGCALACATGSEARAEEVERDALPAHRFSVGVPIVDLALLSSSFELDGNPDWSQSHSAFGGGIALGYAYAPIPYFAVGGGWEWRHPLWPEPPNIHRFRLAATARGILPLADGAVELGLELALGWAWQRWQINRRGEEPFEHGDHLFAAALTIPVTLQASKAWSVFILPGAGYDIGSRGVDRYQPSNVHFLEVTAGVGYRL